MSRTSMYNHNYPGKRVEKGLLTTADAIKITQDYLARMLTLSVTKDVNLYSAVNGAQLLNMCMSDFIRVSNLVSVELTINTVNYWMSINEYANEHVLALVCSYIENMLFQADRYRGFNNFRWSNEGSTLWHNDYANKYNSEEDHMEAMKAMRDEKYQSQEYHRVYY